MVDTNRPVAWRVIDNEDPKAIVGTYATADEANHVCENLEPRLTRARGLRFTAEPVRSTDRYL